MLGKAKLLTSRSWTPDTSNINKKLECGGILSFPSHSGESKLDWWESEPLCPFMSTEETVSTLFRDPSGRVYGQFHVLGSAQEVMKKLPYTYPTCELLNQLWGHILNLTMATRPSVLFILKGANLDHQSVSFICMGDLNEAWTLGLFMLAIEAHLRTCLLQNLTTWT